MMNRIMKNKYSIVVLILVSISLFSCSPKLAGTWKIVKYEINEPGKPVLILKDIGTLKLKKNGEGEKNIRYTALGKEHSDNSKLGWYVTGPYIGIESPGSEFSKTWVMLVHKKKEQKWKTTDGTNKVQIMELKK